MDSIKILHLKNGDGDFVCYDCGGDARMVVQFPYYGELETETFCPKHYEIFLEQAHKAGLPIRIQEVG